MSGKKKTSEKNNAWLEHLKKNPPTNAKNFTEGDIRYAMNNTRSNRAAAKFLGVALSTYRRYAEMYIDMDTGKNLYELHKNLGGKGIPKPNGKKIRETWAKKNADRIEQGKLPWRLRGGDKRSDIIAELMLAGRIPAHCEKCGFNQRRLADGDLPVKVIHKDGDKTNWYADNLQVICYNCYFLYVGNLYGPKISKKLRKGLEKMEEKGLMPIAKGEIPALKLDDDTDPQTFEMNADEMERLIREYNNEGNSESKED